MSASEEEILAYIEQQQKPVSETEDKTEAFFESQAGVDEKAEQQNKSDIQPIYDIAQGFNDSFLNLLDIPNDVFNWAADKLGSDLRVGSMRDLSAETIGVGTKEGEEKETASYRAGEYMGMGLEFLAPILKIGRTVGDVAEVAGATKSLMSAAKTPSTSKRVVQQINKPFVASPKTAMAVETSGGLASGYGSYYGEEEYGEIGAQVGSLAGIFPALSTIPMHLMKNYAIKSIFPFTDAGSKAKAGEIIRQLREIPGVQEQIQAEMAKVLPGTKHTSARLSKDSYLMALEKVLVKEHPELSHILKEIDSENNVLSQVALRELAGEGAVEDSIKSLGSKYTKLKLRLDFRVDKALDNVKKKITDLVPSSKRSSVNVQANEQIRTALSDARKSESALWNDVDRKAIATTSNSKSVLRNTLMEMEEESDKSIIPKYIFEFLGRINKDGELVGGKWGDSRHVGGIHQLRSRVLQEINNERFGDSVNWNRVRILEDLEDAMLTDMANSSAAKGLDDAIQFSRELNRKFKGDIMSIILRNDRSGGSLAPELTLDSLGTGPKGAYYIKRILEASPDSKQNIEEVLKMDIIHNKIVKEDGLDIKKAKDYLSHNEETMNMFPQLKDDMEEAISLAEIHKYFDGSAKARMDKAQKALGYSLAESDPGTFLNKIMKSKDPEKAMARVMRQMNDKGRAGIKNDVINMIFDKAKKKSELVGGAGEESYRLSGVKAIGFWNENKKIFSQNFKKDELDRLDTILNTLRLDDAPKNLPVGVAEEALIPKETVLSYAIGVAAARFGAKLGAGTSGASLRTASQATKITRKLLGDLDINAAKKLLTDAIQDKELFIALSKDATEVQLNKKAFNVLQSWMLAHVVDSLEEKKVE